jgi:hypothetical protein
VTFSAVIRAALHGRALQRESTTLAESGADCFAVQYLTRYGMPTHSPTASSFQKSLYNLPLEATAPPCIYMRPVVRSTTCAVLGPNHASFVVTVAWIVRLRRLSALVAALPTRPQPGPATCTPMAD